MAEALVAVGAVSGILQIMTFSCSVAKQTFHLINSSDEALRENIVVERLTRENELISGRIAQANTSGVTQSKDEASSTKLALECKTEAGKLLKLLDDLKVQTDAQGARRFLQGGLKAFKALRLKNEIKSRQAYLEKLNGQLVTSLIHLLKTNQIDLFDDVISHVQQAQKKTAADVLEAKSAILQVLEETKAELTKNAGSEIQNASKQAYNRNQDDTEKVQLITDSLRFPEIHKRREAVKKAYNKTFEWIFRDASSPFLTWLQSGRHIFWIRGKPGSGKSTLMKYLARHDKTLQVLKENSHPHNSIVAEYYFWYLGTPIQKSIDGLLRSLLYQIFKQCPKMVPITCQSRWEESSAFQRDPDSWTSDELFEVLGRVAETYAMDTRFCFFIDGLDELSGNHHTLIILLQKLVRHPCVKICASSRPWNVFLQAFAESPRTFRLEDLTKGDIATYVRGELSDLPASPEFQQLVSKIVSKAQGVFLWVYLAVYSLRCGLIEGDNIKTLWQRLEEFPSELEEFFEQILFRVDSVYKQQTTSSLWMALLLNNRPEGQKSVLDSFLCYWLVTQNIEDPNFAIDATPRYVSPSEIEQMAKDTKRALNAWCRDLLYLSLDDFNPTYAWASLEKTKVEFLHRTVYDFLKSDHMGALLSRSIPDHFQRPEFLQHVTLAQLKLVPQDMSCLVQYEETVCAITSLSTGNGRLQAERRATVLYYVRNGLTRAFSNATKAIIFQDPTLVDGASSHPWPLLAATLGLLEPHQFDPVYVYSSLIRTILDAGGRPNQVLESTGLSIWQSFLQRWLSSQPMRAYLPSRTRIRENHRRHWKIVQLLIEHSADTQSKVPCPPPKERPGSPARDQADPDWYTVNDILRICLPFKLLEEVMVDLPLENPLRRDFTDSLNTIELSYAGDIESSDDSDDDLPYADNSDDSD